jgi:hypothetical protein
LHFSALYILCDVEGVEMSLTVSQNVNSQQYVPSTGSKVGGILAGGISASAGMTILQGIWSNGIVFPEMKKVAKNMTQEEVTSIRGAAFEMLKQTGLAEKGVKIIETTPEGMELLKQQFRKWVDKSIFYKTQSDIKKERVTKQLINHPLIRQLVNMVKEGDNALYMSIGANSVLIPADGKLCQTIFHELGHAMNFNLNKATKLRFHCVPLKFLSIPILLTGLFKTKKEQPPQGTFDKTTTFIKENAGKLTFLAFLPLLVEEAAASIKGGKFAKKLLNPELAAKISATHKLAWSTYLLQATLTGLGAWLAVKLKDHITDKSIAKQKTENRKQ